MRVPEEPRKGRQIPVWVEGVLIAAFLGMAGVEGMHGEWFFAVIFGVAAVGFGVTFAMRFFAGGKGGG